jgi:DNA recombination protein RmuC
MAEETIMELNFIFIPGFAILMLVIIALFMRLRELGSMRREIADILQQSRTETQGKLDALQNQVLSNAQMSTQTLQNQFRESSQLIRDVSSRLMEVGKTNTQILDFSRQLQSLENILKNPKQRGVLGEYFLETLLGNVLQPNQYAFQYPFSDGEKVDAVVFYRERVIPVDAKFSLENFNRLMTAQDPVIRDQIEREFRADVKKRIDETAKYIRPREKTTDFAFMFVPAEGVYYNLLSNSVGSGVRAQDLVEYAFGKHVIIVSPTSFYAYLETVLMGLRAEQVENGVKDIIKRIQDLDSHLKTFEQFFLKLGTSLSLTVSHFNSASKEYGKIDKDIYRITDGTTGGNAGVSLIDKPRMGE